MKGTRATRILATVFHKHKYITNMDVTPEDCVIAAAGKLAYELKGRITLHLSESTLDQLKLIWAILKKGWKNTVQQHPPRKNPTPPPPPPPDTQACNTGNLSDLPNRTTYKGDTSKG